MPHKRTFMVTLAMCVFLAWSWVTPGGQQKKQEGDFNPVIPKTWDEAAMRGLEVPLANPVGSPQPAPAEYYYRLPIRPIYKSYPVYAPGHEPAGYIEKLQQLEPEIVWDDAHHRPALQTEADWIKAGEIVFAAPLTYGNLLAMPGGLYVRDPEWLQKTGVPVSRDGRLPTYSYFIREKGKVELGVFACAMCHTRVMPDGSVIQGAQGNFPFDRVFANDLQSGADVTQPTHLAERSLFAVPWLKPDPQAALIDMPISQIVAVHRAIPPGVMARHRSSPFFPPHIPDLIGVRDRHYLDATGLQRQDSIADLMRYAALNQGADDLASYDGFVPIDIPNFKSRPEIGKINSFATPDRYGDEQLYALALYVYSLRPPTNPNKFDDAAKRGQKIFESEGCIGCHTPPLYTNNMLTPAEGFTPPEDHAKKYNILPVSVGTDANLTMKTRRGTGYYKVPSLKGVWYRSMFGHGGWCATLEDWFDPRRTRDDYVPTGFKPHSAKTYAVKGHEFGLDLSPQEKKALIAFLKTL
ncbi:MAG: hypothetical protein ACE145_17845 [Terriglobia bacterium]